MCACIWSHDQQMIHVPETAVLPVVGLCLQLVWFEKSRLCSPADTHNIIITESEHRILTVQQNNVKFQFLRNSRHYYLINQLPINPFLFSMVLMSADKIRPGSVETPQDAGMLSSFRFLTSHFPFPIYTVVIPQSNINRIRVKWNKAQKIGQLYNYDCAFFKRI